ncbi:divergent polysaccharide deacetylase family protein [Fodinicurvata halophila]|uniref:Divergent polysaccharide deacetylase family protein n=1 Tax=Fodinicurvata halophila TaxID=1419723 RepID=A0ABV8ULG2_9PROT
MQGKRLAVFSLGILLTLGLAVAIGFSGMEDANQEDAEGVVQQTSLAPVEGKAELAGTWPLPQPRESSRPEVLQPPEILTERNKEEAPWRLYGAAADFPDGTPRIAVIIDDMGLNRSAARRAAELPPPFTLAYLSYAENVEKLISDSRARGHEIMLHLPMEPMNGEIDSGPRTLLSEQAYEERQQDLVWALERFGEYVGVNNHMGSRLTANRDAMKQVLAEVKERGLLFVDSRTSAETVALDVARELGVPSIGRDVFLDHEQSREFIEAQLAHLEDIARKRGSAVGIAHPHDVTLEVLSEWQSDLKERGFTLVPVSDIVREYQERIARLAETPAELPEKRSPQSQ